MALSTFVALHLGHGQAVTAPDYLYRVLLHLVAVGGVAALVLWGLRLVEAVRSGGSAERSRPATER